MYSTLESTVIIKKYTRHVQQHVVNSNVPNYDNLIQMILYLLYGDL